MLSTEARRLLVATAESSIVATLLGGSTEPPEVDGVPEELARPGASFVTLEREARLLGCIGTIEPARPLLVDVALNAVGAAFRDPRLPAVTLDDYRAMDVKISVLTPLEVVPAADAAELRRLVVPAVDGLLVESAHRRGTFLPSVWRQLPDVDDFLLHLWRKAGLPAGSWPADLRVWRYRTVEFGASGPRALPGASTVV